jgi:hypothetical protein
MSVNDDKYRGTVEYVRVLAELVRAAEHKGVTNYQNLALLMKLPIVGSHMGSETGKILGEISEDEIALGRPMLSAVCVTKEGGAGAGFFVLARQLGRLEEGGDEDAFWRAELKAVYETWRRPMPWKKQD